MEQQRGVKELEQEEKLVQARPQGLGTFSSLAHKDYRYLWISTLFASSGQWIEMVTLNWLVYEMTNSSVILGLVNGLRAVPFLISGPFGGVAADRVNRKKLMIGTQVLLVLSNFILGLLIYTGKIEVWHIFVFTFATGVSWSFNMPVRQALIPNIVPTGELMNAMALMSAAFNVTRIIGPTVAGLLLVVIGAHGNFLIQGVAYMGVIWMVWLMKVPPIKGTARDSSVLSNLAEGLRYVYRHEIVMPLMVMALIPIILAMPYLTLMPVFAKDVFGIGPEGFGLFMSAPGIGALAGTLTLASFAGFRRKGALLIALATALGFALILFGSSRWLPLSMVFLVAVGGTLVAYMATNNVVIQMLIPDNLRGRVMAIYMLDQGLAPLGSMFAGTMASYVGAPATTQLMGALVLVLAVTALVKLPQIRKLEV